MGMPECNGEQFQPYSIDTSWLGYKRLLWVVCMNIFHLDFSEIKSIAMNYNSFIQTLQSSFFTEDHPCSWMPRGQNMRALQKGLQVAPSCSKLDDTTFGLGPSCSQLEDAVRHQVPRALNIPGGLKTRRFMGCPKSEITVWLAYRNTAL